MENVVSLEMDALVDTDVDAAIWRVRLPELYAAKYNVSVDEARKRIGALSRASSPLSKEWNKLSYWLERLGLKVPMEELMFGLEIRQFPDAEPVLQILRAQTKRCVLISVSSRELMGAKARELREYFDDAISIVDDTPYAGKCEAFWRYMIEKYSSFSHVGADYEQDCKLPRELGIDAWCIDRMGKANGPYTLRSLAELPLDRGAAPR